MVVVNMDILNPIAQIKTNNKRIISNDAKVVGVEIVLLIDNRLRQ